MRTEIESFRRAQRVGLPMPDLVAADPDAGYLILRRLTEHTLQSVKDRLSASQLASLRREIGTHAARLAMVSGPLYGYPCRDGHTRFTSWRTSFLMMLDDILADAVDYERELPAPAAAIRQAVDAHAHLLDEVTTPVLVHFDLWDGNVFVLPENHGYRVEGVIDGERAFYGDRLAELTSLAFFADPEEVPGVLDGFLGRSLTEAEETRVRLYRIYLYLIMVTEGATRNYDPAEHEPVRQYTLNQLDAQLNHL